MNMTTWTTRAAFQMTNGAGWTWLTWTHDSEERGNKHAVILRKAKEIGAVRWDFSQADHSETPRFRF
jgi:hypothetical protein